MKNHELIKLIKLELRRGKKLTTSELYNILKKKTKIYKTQFSGILHGLAMSGILIETRGSGRTRFYSLPKKK